MELWPFVIQTLARFGARLYTGPMDGGNDEMGENATPRRATIAELLWPPRYSRRVRQRAAHRPFRSAPWGSFLLCVVAVSCVLSSGMLITRLPQLGTSVQAGFFILALIAALVAVANLGLAIPCGMIYLLIPGSRGLGLRIVIGSAIFLSIFYAFGSCGTTLRAAAFRDLAQRSMPLVQAVNAFEDVEGRLPKSLEELVPRYLARVPGTGMAAYPDYDYLTGKEATFWLDNPWVIRVRTHSLDAFDQFLYFPLQNYPEDFEGNECERMGTWAYMHE